MIRRLLPNYYKAFGKNPVYKFIKSWVIDGHEVAWMEYSGTAGGRKYSMRLLRCECNFTKGVGWDVKGSTDGKPYSISGNSENCPARKEVVRLRHLELRKEYLKRFKAGNDLRVLRRYIEEIISDLIGKVKAGEFLEDGSGASFWGGYFYLQTLAAIIDPPMNIWKVGESLVQKKKISLEGAVVRDYREPLPPAWKEGFRIERNKWIGIASLPAHGDMASVWKLDVLKPDGSSALDKSVFLAVLHAPIFGPDISDVKNAKRKLHDLMNSIMKR